jgi:hypothetical protein
MDNCCGRNEPKAVKRQIWNHSARMLCSRVFFCIHGTLLLLVLVSSCVCTGVEVFAAQIQRIIISNKLTAKDPSFKRL